LQTPPTVATREPKAPVNAAKFTASKRQIPEFGESAKLYLQLFDIKILFLDLRLNGYTFKACRPRISALFLTS
jgi:hypothetical protein